MPESMALTVGMNMDGAGGEHAANLAIPQE
jgi:hypothetical protein